MALSPMHPASRFRVLKEGLPPGTRDPGPVVYWMFRDQRVKDNWALIHAVDQANKKNVPVAVAFNLFDQFKGAKSRHLGFMLRGLRLLCSKLEDSFHIPFFLLQGDAGETIPNFLKECGASLLVTDFCPLREVRKCKDMVCQRVSDSVTVHEVDAHNVVPAWVASDKLEYGARTIRAKINKKLPDYLVDFPDVQIPIVKWIAPLNQSIDWDKLTDDVTRKGADVPELKWCIP